MKRDGRTLDHKTLEEIRRMAVQRVWDGERPSAVVASYGLSRQIIYKWLKQAGVKDEGCVHCAPERQPGDRAG
jgi:transposase-like protein